MNTKNALCLLATTLAFALCERAGAQEAAKPIPDDPAFRAFFDAKSLGDALVAADANRLTDCALLLAHGESVLLRGHAHVSSTKLFDLALRLAVDKADPAALKRLDKALRGKADATAIAQLDAALLFGKQKRKVDPFAHESSSAEGLVVYKSMNDQIKMAKNLNDRESLEGFKKTITTLTELTAQQRKHLTSQVEESLKAAPQAPAAEDDFLAQLARASRGKKVVTKR